MKYHILSADEKDALNHALDLADQTLREDVEMWKRAQPCNLVTANGIASMRELFRDYVDRLARLRSKLQPAESIVLVADDEDPIRTVKHAIGGEA